MVDPKRFKCGICGGKSADCKKYTWHPNPQRLHRPPETPIAGHPFNFTIALTAEDLQFLAAEDTVNQDGEIQVPGSPNSQQPNTNLTAGHMHNQDAESQLKTSSGLQTPDSATAKPEDVPGEMIKKRSRSMDYEPGTGGAILREGSHTINMRSDVRVNDGAARWGIPHLIVRQWLSGERFNEVFVDIVGDRHSPSIFASGDPFRSLLPETSAENMFPPLKIRKFNCNIPALSLVAEQAKYSVKTPENLG
ncbi:hypothetical protein B0H14DRAFT_2588264 [Mycena olivaceomarginata]|nr:hypothetical protein B0H14DRAFT_2588264 [Mycena olivaceomarginata]